MIYEVRRRTKAGVDKHYKTVLFEDLAQYHADKLNLLHYPRYLFYVQPRHEQPRTGATFMRMFRIWRETHGPS